MHPGLILRERCTKSPKTFSWRNTHFRKNAYLYKILAQFHAKNFAPGSHLALITPVDQRSKAFCCSACKKYLLNTKKLVQYRKLI